MNTLLKHFKIFTSISISLTITVSDRNLLGKLVYMNLIVKRSIPVEISTDSNDDSDRFRL